MSLDPNQYIYYITTKPGQELLYYFPVSDTFMKYEPAPWVKEGRDPNVSRQIYTPWEKERIYEGRTYVILSHCTLSPDYASMLLEADSPATLTNPDEYKAFRLDIIKKKALELFSNNPASALSENVPVFARTTDGCSSKSLEYTTFYHQVRYGFICEKINGNTPDAADFLKAFFATSAMSEPHYENLLWDFLKRQAEELFSKDPSLVRNGNLPESLTQHVGGSAASLSRLARLYHNVRCEFIKKAINIPDPFTLAPDLIDVYMEVGSRNASLANDPSFKKFLKVVIEKKAEELFLKDPSYLTNLVMPAFLPQYGCSTIPMEIYLKYRLECIKKKAEKLFTEDPLFFDMWREVTKTALQYLKGNVSADEAAAIDRFWMLAKEDKSVHIKEGENLLSVHLEVNYDLGQDVYQSMDRIQKEYQEKSQKALSRLAEKKSLCNDQTLMAVLNYVSVVFPLWTSIDHNKSLRSALKKKSEDFDAIFAYDVNDQLKQVNTLDRVYGRNLPGSIVDDRHVVKVDEQLKHLAAEIALLIPPMQEHEVFLERIKEMKDQCDATIEKLDFRVSFTLPVVLSIYQQTARNVLNACGL